MNPHVKLQDVALISKTKVIFKIPGNFFMCIASYEMILDRAIWGIVDFADVFIRIEPYFDFIGTFGTGFSKGVNIDESIFTSNCIYPY